MNNNKEKLNELRHLVINCPLDAILRDYNTELVNYLISGTRPDYSAEYENVKHTSNCDTYYPVLDVVASVDTVSEKTLERYAKKDMENIGKLSLIFWLCIIYNASFPDAVRLIASAGYIINGYFDNAEFYLIILYYIDRFPDDPFERCELVSMLLTEHRLGLI